MGKKINEKNGDIHIAWTSHYDIINDTGVVQL